jgi:hypothetical protein
MLGQVVQLGGSVTLYGRRNCVIGIVSQLLWATAWANLASAAVPSVDRALQITRRGRESRKELAKPAKQT